MRSSPVWAHRTATDSRLRDTGTVLRPLAGPSPRCAQSPSTTRRPAPRCAPNPSTTFRPAPRCAPSPSTMFATAGAHKTTRSAAQPANVRSPREHTFASWREGTALDVGAWLTPRDRRTPCVIVSVAHLDDDERALVLGVLFEEILTWVRPEGGRRGARRDVRDVPARECGRARAHGAPHPAGLNRQHAAVTARPRPMREVVPADVGRPAPRPFSYKRARSAPCAGYERRRGAFQHHARAPAAGTGTGGSHVVEAATAEAGRARPGGLFGGSPAALARRFGGCGSTGGTP
jgi:hypothetical protein